jgi:hypothetical protein
MPCWGRLKGEDLTRIDARIERAQPHERANQQDGSHREHESQIEGYRLRARPCALSMTRAIDARGARV